MKAKHRHGRNMAIGERWFNPATSNCNLSARKRPLDGHFWHVTTIRPGVPVPTIDLRAAGA